jgi:hypothetical protein
MQESLQTEAVRLSVATQVPCYHTATVGFATTRARYKQFAAAPPAQRSGSLAKFAAGSAIADVAGAATACASAVPPP